MVKMSHVAVAIALGQGAKASLSDLQRAKMKVPGDEYRGDGQTHMSHVLNQHLQKGEPNVRSCEHWSVHELQDFMAMVAEHRNEEAQSIYRATADKRQLRHEHVHQMRAEWDHLNHIVGNHPHLLPPQQQAHCRQAVMWWTHHLHEEKRQELRSRNVSVPLLPVGEKLQCGRGEGPDEERVCLRINEENSCDWCHSSQADHDAGKPGTSVPDALTRFNGPDDGNPHGWDRKRRCDQDQMPRCGLCEGVGGRAWSDTNEDIDLTPCEIVAEAADVDPSTVAPPIYPKQFTVRRQDGKQGGYSDTLIGWKTDPFCFGFFPQNDSIPELCYRSEDAMVKYYDITRQAMRAEYTLKSPPPFGLLPNTTATILQVQDRMWIMNKIGVLPGVHVNQCICADPSGNHCTNPPCHTYIHRYDTFETAQYLGREKINAEWIQNHGTGASGKPMELDHFILWSHHVWTDPVSRRLVRAWKPFNGLQLYDPEAWTDSIVGDADELFQAPPNFCAKGGGAAVRIHCDDDGNYAPGESDGVEMLEQMIEQMLQAAVGKEELV